MTDTEKAWIDSADYETLLRRWRFSEMTDSIFQGESGKYYSDRMFSLRNANETAAVAASKRIGWG